MTPTDELLTQLNQWAQTATMVAPAVVEEYLRWCWISHTIGLGLGVFAMLAAIPVAWWSATAVGEDALLPLIVAVVLGVTAVFAVPYNAYGLIKLHCAPQAYLLADLIRLAK